MIREYTEVLSAAAEEQAKEFSTQSEGRQQQVQQQLQQQQQIQMANNQLRFHHQMQATKNGPSTMPQNQSHFRHAQHGTLVPPQPS